MAMGAVKGQESTLQVAMICLDELVPEDCRYRKLDRLVDWSFVRELAAPYYAEEVGRPSIDPVVLVKLVVAGALEGIGSAREFCRVASLRLDLRRFLGYGFHERLPAHQTLSHAQTRRFVDGQLFELLFLRSVALCREHGLIEGTHLSVDGFHAEADAALASLRASLAAAASEELDGHDSANGEQPAPSAPPQLSLAKPRPGPTPKRRSSNATSVSRTDPDARLRGKPGQRPHLVYRGQVAVDPKSRCVVACLGEEADGYEGDGLEPILDRARFACPELAAVGADSGFAAERVWRGVERRGLVAYIPPQPTMLPKPGEEATTEAQRQALVARARCKSERGILAHKRRMADAEGVIGELKNQHGLDRVRCRGTPLFRVQLLLGCTALNCKRLADHVPEAASGVAGTPLVARGNLPPAAAGACRVNRAAQGAPCNPLGRPFDAALSTWSYVICLN
jgi:transposase